MLVTYDGSTFFGFQYQIGVPTVQGELERALTRLLNHKVRIIGASRTDTGVHALGQVVVFDTENPIPTEKLLVALNNILPMSIRITELSEIHKEFHPRYHAKAKLYRYLYLEVKKYLPFFSNYFFQVTSQLDDELMAKGAKEFIGVHDFSSFIKSPESKKDTKREIYISSVKRNKKAIIFEIVGNGFAHNMVRNMAKALYLLGTHEITISDLQNLLVKTDRKILKDPAPAGGLYLVKVFY